MRKLVIILGVFLLVGVMAYPVLARGPGYGRGCSGWGSGDGQGNGPGYCWQDQGGYPASAPGGQLNSLGQKFYNDTETLRKNIWNKENEMTSLLNGENPDREKLGILQKEISQLRTQMDEKRLAYRIETRKAAPEGTYGGGYGRGRGGYGRNWGGPCWN